MKHFAPGAGEINVQHLCSQPVMTYSTLPSTLSFPRRQVCTHVPDSTFSAPDSLLSGAVSLGVDRCRHSHNHRWDPVAYRVHEPLLESACAGVVGHPEVPDSEEEVQPFEEHPGEGGQVEVMEYTGDDLAQHLEGRGGHWSGPGCSDLTTCSSPGLSLGNFGERCSLAFFTCPSSLRVMSPNGWMVPLVYSHALAGCHLGHPRKTEMYHV